MSVKDCLSRLKVFLKESGLDENIPKSRVDYFARRLDAISADSMSNVEFRKKAQEFIEGDLERDALARKASRAQAMLRNSIDSQAVLDNVEKWSENPKKYGNPNKMPYEAARVMQQGGSLRPGQGTNMSVPLMELNYRSHLLKLTRQILSETPGLRSTVESGALGWHEPLKALEALNNKTSLEGTPQDVLAFAKMYKEVSERIFQMKQAINPKLGMLQDFLVHQSYDPERALTLGRDQFVSLMMKNAADKSFLGMDPSEKPAQFGKMWDKIQSRKWGSVYDDQTGTGGREERMAASREIHYNDSQALANVMSEVGPKTMYQGLMDSIHKASNDIAWLNKAGPDREAWRENWIGKLEKSLDGEQLAQFKRDRPRLDQEWSVAKGSQNSPAYNWRARTTQNLMSLEYLGKALGAVLHSGNDAVILSGLAHSIDGSGVLRNIPEIVATMTKHFLSTTARETHLSDLEMMTGTMQKELLRADFVPDAPLGSMSKLTEMAGKLSFIDRWHSSMKAATGELLTKRLGRLAEIAHADLPTPMQEGLSRYNWDQASWDLARKFGREEIGGSTRITPEGMRAIPDAVVENYLRKEGGYTGKGAPSGRVLDQVRDTWALRTGVMLNENSLLAAAEGDLRQRDWMWGDTHINEGMGQFRRMLWQFSRASLVQMDAMRRVYFSSGATRGDLAAPAAMLAGSMVLYAIQHGVKGVINGKTPEDPASAHYIGQIIAGGAVGGQYIDAAANVMEAGSIPDKFKALLKTAAGPVMGDTAELAISGAQGIQELTGNAKGNTALPEITKTLTGLAPFRSLPVGGPLLDYYIFNALKEWASPGILQRQESYFTQEPALGGGNRSYLYGRPTSSTLIE